MELEKSGDLEGECQGVDTGTIVDIESKLIIIDAHLQKHLRQLQRQCKTSDLPQSSKEVRFIDFFNGLNIIYNDEKDNASLILTFIPMKKAFKDWKMPLLQ